MKLIVPVIIVCAAKFVSRKDNNDDDEKKDVETEPRESKEHSILPRTGVRNVDRYEVAQVISVVPIRTPQQPPSQTLTRAQLAERKHMRRQSSQLNVIKLPNDYTVPRAAGRKGAPMNRPATKAENQQDRLKMRPIGRSLDTPLTPRALKVTDI